MTRCLHLLLVLACAAGAAAAADPADVLLDADRQFAKDSAARGVAAWEAWFADDAVIFPPSGPPVRGLDNVKARWRDIKFDPTGLEWTPLRGEMSAGGDLGYTYGTWRKGEATGKYMTVWRRGKDGRYKVAADIGAPDAPSKPQ